MSQDLIDRYDVVQVNTLSLLKDCVADRIRNGWQPLGGVAHVVTLDKAYFSQAVVSSPKLRESIARLNS